MLHPYQKLLIGLTPLILLPAGCGGDRRHAEAAARATAPEAIPVRVAAAETRRIARSIAVTGSLAADETVSVSSEVSGRLAEVHFDFGQQVRKGQVIAELDKREFTIQHERARAALAQALARIGLNPGQEEATPDDTPAIRQARALMEEARFKFENAEKLVKSGDISRERFIELEKAYRAREAAYQGSRDELRVALANVLGLRAEVRLAEKRLSDATVRAPFDGAITARLASPGQYLRENAPIVTLVKSFPLRLRVEIPESDAGAVRPGGSLTFTTDAAPGARFSAAVTELNPALESRSRSLTAEARLTRSDPRLRPGMFVQVELGVAQDATAVVIPKEALYQVAGLTKVFIVRGDRVSEAKIAPGRDIEGWVEVPGDRIHPGDKLAVSKLPMLTDGAQITVQR